MVLLAGLQVQQALQKSAWPTEDGGGPEEGPPAHLSRRSICIDPPLPNLFGEPQQQQQQLQQPPRWSLQTSRAVVPTPIAMKAFNQPAEQKSKPTTAAPLQRKFRDSKVASSTERASESGFVAEPATTGNISAKSGWHKARRVLAMVQQPQPAAGRLAQVRQSILFQPHPPIAAPAVKPAGKESAMKSRSFSVNIVNRINSIASYMPQMAFNLRSATAAATAKGLRVRMGVASGCLPNNTDIKTSALFELAKGGCAWFATDYLSALNHYPLLNVGWAVWHDACNQGLTDRATKETCRTWISLGSGCGTHCLARVAGLSASRLCSKFNSCKE
jgi:hypothetical protein